MNAYQLLLFATTTTNTKSILQTFQESAHLFTIERHVVDRQQVKLLSCHEASCCPSLAAFRLRLRVPLHRQKWLGRFLPGQALQRGREGASGDEVQKISSSCANVLVG